MKKEREEEGGGAAMPPSLVLPSPSTASAARVLGRAMEGASGFYSLRAPSPIVRAMRTRLNPPPPLAAAPPPPPLPPPPPPQVPEKRRRGRPRNCDRLLPPPGFLLPPPARAPPALAAPWPTLAAHGQCQLGGLQPHVLKIDVGEDVVSRIVEVSQMNGKAVCVLSVLGAVQEANLLHSSSVILNHKGPLEIVRMFGSILTPDAPRFKCLSVTLACADFSVVGGVIAGPLIAATPVQATIGSFYNDAFWPNKAPKIIAHNPNSQVTTGYGVTSYPNSHVAISNGISHRLGSLFAIGTGNMRYPNSQVAIDGRTHWPNSWIPIRYGSTHHPNSHVTIGDGSARHCNSQVPVGTGSTDQPNSHVTVSDGTTNNINSQATIGDGSMHYPESQVTGGDGSTSHANSHVTAGNGSTNNTISLVTLGDGSMHYPKF
uniref:AT-hook motif nuclear-localized protein n=1 Tax=Arundo donax TaxID=35708 RepID=A0A0A9BH54_ARUDO